MTKFFDWLDALPRNQFLAGMVVVLVISLMVNEILKEFGRGRW